MRNSRPTPARCRHVVTSRTLPSRNRPVGAWTGKLVPPEDVKMFRWAVDAGDSNDQRKRECSVYIRASSVQENRIPDGTSKPTKRTGRQLLGDGELRVNGKSFTWCFVTENYLTSNATRVRETLGPSRYLLFWTISLSAVLRTVLPPLPVQVSQRRWSLQTQ